jgi:tetratricopeptide (TPR) repeat protein
MSFRFFKRFQIAPGLTVNLSKSGLSLSVGPRGAKVTLGPKGVRTTVGIPGTGVSYTKHHAYGKSAPAPSRTPRDAAEEGLLSACHALDQQQAEVALDRLRQAGTLPDACWMAGFLLLEGKRPDEALAAFEVAHARAEVLGQSFDALGVEIAMELPVTPQLSLSLAPGPQSAALGLVEALQLLGNPLRAIEVLQGLLASDPVDSVVLLSLTELTWDTWKHDPRALEYVIGLTDRLAGDDDLHAALLLYRARAFRELGRFDAAREVLMKALSRPKKRSQEVLLALRYERALVYEARGEHRAARSELERILAADAGYEDVRARLSR